ncbi:MAG: phosphatase PAP2 family protein [Sinomicrobium sp.]|nr:phosphatase PAP2 family protein [Sinomicrobium sp.]
MNSIIEYDKALFLFLNSLGNETWDGFWLAVTNTYTAVPLYAVLLFLTVRRFGVKSALVIVLLVALMITGTDQLANAFKYGFERLRPCHDETVMHAMRLVKPHCGGKFGFFSAHAANSSAVAAFFSLVFAKHYSVLPLLLTMWAILVAYSRIYIGVHYPLDVITGMSVGMLAGWLFYTLKNKVENRI